MIDKASINKLHRWFEWSWHKVLVEESVGGPLVMANEQGRAQAWIFGIVVYRW